MLIIMKMIISLIISEMITLRLEMFNYGYDIHCNAEIDPDNIFCNNYSYNFKYYTDHQFSNFQSDKVFSIMHFSCRRISADFT